MAIKTRKPLPGLVHHCDRGIQYASAEYFAILKQHAMARSMGGHRTGSSSGFSRGGSDIDDRKCHGKRNAKNGSCKNHSDRSLAEADPRRTVAHPHPFLERAESSGGYWSLFSICRIVSGE